MTAESHDKFVVPAKFRTRNFRRVTDYLTVMADRVKSATVPVSNFTIIVLLYGQHPKHKFAEFKRKVLPPSYW
jgi:hypothetical protein